MSALQDDIDFVGPLTLHDVGGPLSADRVARVVEAARRVANLDLEAFHKAIYEWYHSERPMSYNEERKLINAALGISGNEMSELQDALDLYDDPRFIIIQEASPELRTIIKAARKYANLPALDDEVRAAIQRAYMSGYTDGDHDGAMPVEWEIETESINQWMGSELVAALSVTEDE